MAAGLNALRATTAVPANVIVLEGNPLKRIENLEHVRFVMKRGVL